MKSIPIFIKWLRFSGRFIPVIATLLFLSCAERDTKTSDGKVVKREVEHPEWSKNVNIYEVNVRQYTEQGTFQAFQEHLPRLKEMGVDILWFMPIHPVGEKNRKGTLGSYYAVKDYKAVNPEFGTLDDFKKLVDRAHEMGFKVIIDWVANHTAWDNPWIFDHPEWYTTDSLGQKISPFDWSDVADLNYDNPELWDAMTDALKFWVIEADIDGYRCDVAGMVPTEFWDRARAELDAIKPVFMLAEAEQTDLHKYAFDMTYAWELHHIFNEIAKGNKNADDVEVYFAKHDTTYPSDAYRMNFITNHDENSWNGTIHERLGDAASVMAVLTYTLPGMPLIYSGQEVGLDKRLKFFEKDTIQWDYDSPLIEFYTTLNNLKRANKAFWNGNYGGLLKRIPTTNNEWVYAFIRTAGSSQFLILANLTNELVSVQFLGDDFAGTYVDLFSNEELTLEPETNFGLSSWDYYILERK